MKDSSVLLVFVALLGDWPSGGTVQLFFRPTDAFEESGFRRVGASVAWGLWREMKSRFKSFILLANIKKYFTIFLIGLCNVVRGGVNLIGPEIPKCSFRSQSRWETKKHFLCLGTEWHDVKTMRRLANTETVLWKYSKRSWVPLDFDNQLHYQMPVHRWELVRPPEARAVCHKPNNESGSVIGLDEVKKRKVTASEKQVEH